MGEVLSQSEIDELLSALSSGEVDVQEMQNKDEKVVYLTFDEGYENGYTASILDTLKEKGVTAVFFVTMPYVKQNPELIQRMIDENQIVRKSHRESSIHA